MTPDSTLAVTNTCPKDGVHLWLRVQVAKWAMPSHAPSYHGYRFPSEIISHAVWLYYRFALKLERAQ